MSEPTPYQMSEFIKAKGGCGKIYVRSSDNCEVICVLRKDHIEKHDEVIDYKTEHAELRLILREIWENDRAAGKHGGSRFAHTGFGDRIWKAIGDGSQPWYVK